MVVRVVGDINLTLPRPQDEKGHSLQNELARMSRLSEAVKKAFDTLWACHRLRKNAGKVTMIEREYRMRHARTGVSFKASKRCPVIWRRTLDV